MSDRPAAATVQRFWAGLEMAAGGMIATLCGGCALFSATLMGGSFSGISIAAVLGGLPALAGVILFRDGLTRWRRAGAAAHASSDAERVDP